MSESWELIRHLKKGGVIDHKGKEGNYRIVDGKIILYDSSGGGEIVVVDIIHDLIFQPELYSIVIPKVKYSRIVYSDNTSICNDGVELYDWVGQTGDVKSTRAHKFKVTVEEL